MRMDRPRESRARSSRARTEPSRLRGPACSQRSGPPFSPSYAVVAFFAEAPQNIGLNSGPTYSPDILIAVPSASDLAVLCARLGVHSANLSGLRLVAGGARPDYNPGFTQWLHTWL